MMKNSMRFLNWLYHHKQGVEIVILNIFGASVIGWLKSVLSEWTSIVAGLFALSVVVMNVLKIYGLYLDNTRKRRELNRDVRRSRRK